MTFICLNIELRTQPLIILIVIAGTDKERPGCSKIRLSIMYLLNKPDNFKLYSTNNREFVDRKVIFV
jgi:hypothetical protein